MSFLLVERLFHAGREKLLTYGWLKWIMDRVEAVRNWVADIKRSVIAMVRSWLRQGA
jgi:copper homeostasis protein CutC